MLYDWVKEFDWLYHYEVVVTRHGRDYVIARVPSRTRAEMSIGWVRRGVEISWTTVQWRRMRGVHPANAAKFCMLVLVLALMLPWFWPRLVMSLLCTAMICGLLSSGGRWKQGGEDDR